MVEAPAHLLIAGLTVGSKNTILLKSLWQPPTNVVG